MSWSETSPEFIRIYRIYRNFDNCNELLTNLSSRKADRADEAWSIRLAALALKAREGAHVSRG